MKQDIRLRPKEAAEHCGISRRFLDECVRKGVGPAQIKLSPRLIYYAVTDLEAWLASHRVEAAA